MHIYAYIYIHTVLTHVVYTTRITRYHVKDCLPERRVANHTHALMCSGHPSSLSNQAYRAAQSL